jgi:hypothetical protein
VPVRSLSPTTTGRPTPEEFPLRRRLLALSLALASLLLLAPAAGADTVAVGEDEPYVCIRSRPLFGDQALCVKYYPGA